VTDPAGPPTFYMARTAEVPVPSAQVLSDKGAQLPTPLTLDGGEARTITVRIMVSGTPLLEKMIHDFNEPNNGTLMDPHIAPRAVSRLKHTLMPTANFID
jgi:hypothetical protein